MRWLSQSLIRLGEASLPPLREDEQVLKVAGAKANRGLWTPSGEFILTSERLLFLPHRLPFWPRRWSPAGLDLELSGIRLAETSGGGMNLVAPGMAQIKIHLTGGETLVFYIFGAKTWVTAINSLARQ